MSDKGDYKVDRKCVFCEHWEAYEGIARGPLSFKGRCCRYPDSIPTNPDYCCGEFSLYPHKEVFASWVSLSWYLR